jgi:hypothetical protein
MPTPENSNRLELPDEANLAAVDRQVFLFDEEAFTEFVEALDTPPDDNPGLRALLAAKAPWETCPVSAGAVDTFHDPTLFGDRESLLGISVK